MNRIVLKATLAGKSPEQVLSIIQRQRPDAKMTMRTLQDYQYRLRSVGALPAKPRPHNKPTRARSIRDIVIDATRKGANPKEALAVVKKERPNAKTTIRSIYIIRRDLNESGQRLPHGKGNPQKSLTKASIGLMDERPLKKRSIMSGR
jgi:hypothetical protein